MYESIDAVLAAWSKKNSVHFSKIYKEIEVRTFSIYDPSGLKFQVWIDPPSEAGVKVTAWDYRKRKAEFNGATAHLPELLDLAMKQVGEWILVKRPS